MNLRERLSGRLSKSSILKIAQQMGDDGMKEELYRLTLDADDRVANQALWVFTHFADGDREWLYGKHDELIDRVMAEENVSRRRMILGLLSCQQFDEEHLRADFLDFCLANITACSQPYAVRALCMKLAYEQCRFFSELTDELKATLDMLEQEPLSPGLASAKRQVTEKLRRRNKKTK